MKLLNKGLASLSITKPYPYFKSNKVHTEENRLFPYLLFKDTKKGSEE